MSTSAASAPPASTPAPARCFGNGTTCPAAIIAARPPRQCLFENLLILTFDGADLQYLVALDKKTGKTVWKTNRSVAWNDENVPGQMARDGDLRKAHSTPLIVTVARQTAVAQRRAPRPLMATTRARATNSGGSNTTITRVAPRPVVRERHGFLRHRPDEERNVGGEDRRPRRRHRHEGGVEAQARTSANTPRRCWWTA